MELQLLHPVRQILVVVVVALVEMVLHFFPVARVVREL
jgi:hypothetical protein